MRMTRLPLPLSPPAVGILPSSPFSYPEPISDNWTWLTDFNFTTDFALSNENCRKPPGTPSLTNIISYCYVLPTVCAIGILGNIANLITLSSNRLKAVSYMYLRGLGVADLLCMIFVLIFVSFEMISASPTYRHILNSYGVAWYRAHLVLPLINWTVSAGILIVVALTLERYISIAWPILFREWNSPRRAAIIIGAAYAVTFIVYIPMCWQFEVLPICRMGNESGNGSEGYLRKGEWEGWIGWTVDDNKVLLASQGHSAYKYTREALLKFVPIVALTFLNLQIIYALKKVRNRRRRLNTNNQNATEQRSLLFLLAGIVVLFFICNIPAALNLIIINEHMKTKKAFIAFRATANLLEITNHALNFYNFCLCSSDYRQTFFEKFPCVKRVQESAEDIRRRVSNNAAKVQHNRKGSMIMKNGKVQESNTFVGTSSFRTGNSEDQLVPLRRALSSDTFVRFDHSYVKDGHGRRAGHHYGSTRQSGNYLVVPNGGQTRSEFEIIREISPGASHSSISNAHANINVNGVLALVNQGFSPGEGQSSVMVLTDSSDTEQTPMGTPMTTIYNDEKKSDDLASTDDESGSYSSANDIYL